MQKLQLLEKDCEENTILARVLQKRQFLSDYCEKTQFSSNNQGRKQISLKDGDLDTENQSPKQTI